LETFEIQTLNHSEIPISIVLATERIFLPTG
jgi:hypothetical protein